MRTRQTVLILSLFFVLGLFAARLPATLAQLSGSTSRYDFFDPIIDVYSTIDAAYVDEVDKTKLQLGAINGMLEALEDPYTQFVPPTDRDAFHKELTGQFVGIGAEVVIEDAYLTIVSPLEDSPALEAGIRPGDKVVEIEGESTLNVSVDDCISKLTGKPGTPVNIVIARGGLGGERIPMTIIRRQITARSVRGAFRHSAAKPASTPATASSTDADHAGSWSYLLDPDQRIAYIRLSQFTPTAVEEFKAALDQVRASEPGAVGGLILDLRGDPGGVLDAALELADLFLKDGVIVSVKGRPGAASRGMRDEVHTAKAPGTLPDFPMIVLVNGGSASASEILAGALADHKRAVVLGTRTFGKGLVQAVQPLQRPVWGGALGAQLKFTGQRYYLPSGRMIHRTDDATTWGVDPTPGFYVPMTGEEQLARVLERRDRDILATRADGSTAAEPARWSDPQWIETTLKDKQLAAALRAMNTRLAGGEWKPVSDAQPAEQGEAVSLAELRQLELGRERMYRELERVERRIEALETAAAGDAVTRPTFDLWPDETTIAGGKIDVFDKDGKKIASLNITGQNLERWLIDAGVEPIEPASAAEAPAPSNN